MNYKYVLLLGGYGYGNVGDEAQLSQNIKLWREYAPDFEIIVLSPYPEYTAKTHQCKSDYASREVFFDQNKKSYFWRENLKFKLIYFYTYFKLTINCYLKRIFSFYFFLTKEESHFLNTLINAQYVHFCGGGYLTGKTKSRLWDGIMIMHLCRILKITYFLTGQTIGLFEGKVENFLCKRGFFGAKKISLRDPEESKNELLNLGVKCELITLGDDAIFSSKTSDLNLEKYIGLSNINLKNKFVCLHYHNWGMNRETIKSSQLFFSELIISLREKHNLDSVLIPMSPTDMEEQHVLKKNMRLNTKVFNYNYDHKIIRALISKSYFLISLKHHPLIFSLGEGVPCLTICYDDYYSRKNIGALKNFGLEHFALCKNNINILNIDHLIQQIVSKKNSIVTDINILLSSYKKKQEDFFLKCLEKK